MNLLELNNIRKSFGDLEVLKDISLTVKEGEVVSIIGPSGSGKSTLLRCATMLETADGGDIIYCGEAAFKDAVYAKYTKFITDKQNGVKLSNKEESLISVFEIALEMFERGYYFTNISLDKSLSSRFSLDKDDPHGIVPPFTSVDGLGDSVGDSVVEARKHNIFLSKEDVMKRTKLNNTQVDFLSKIGVFEHLSEENQLSLFDF